VLRALIVLAGACALACGLESLRRGSLYALSFASGWVLAATIVAGVVALHALGGGPTKRRMRVQLVVTTAALGLLLFHVDLRLPRGWVETALAAVLLAAAASTAYGADLVLRGRADVEGPEVARWLRRQAAINAVLIVFTAFHGVLVHAHGALAHAMLSVSGP